MVRQVHVVQVVLQNTDILVLTLLVIRSQESKPLKSLRQLLP